MQETTTMPRASLLLVLLAFISFISLGLPDGLRGVAWPRISADFLMPLGALPQILAAATLGYLSTSFNSGRVLRWLGTGRTLAFSSLLMAIGLFGWFLAPVWALALVSSCLIGLGAGAIDAALNTVAAMHFTPSQMYWMHASFGVGTTISPIIMTNVLGAQQPWRIGYLIVAVIQSFICLTFFLTMQQWKTPTAPESVKQTERRTRFRDTLRLPNVWLGIAMFILYVGLEFTPSDWAPTIMTKARGFSETDAGWWIGAYWGVFTVGRVVSGFITSRVSVRTYMRAVMVGAILSAGWFAANPVINGTGVGMLALPVLGFCLAPMFPSFMTETPERVGAAHAANTIGFQAAAGSLGFVIMGGIAGQLSTISLEAIPVFLFGVSIVMLALHEFILTRPAHHKA